MYRIIIICGSPHMGGSCDYIVDFLERSICEHKVDTIFIRDLKIKPCRGCHSCELDGRCIIDNDDMSFMYKKLMSKANIIVVTPVYFYNVPSVFKNVIDRCQVFWATKYKLGEKREYKRAGMLISIAGSTDMSIFSGVERTIKYFFDVLNVDLKTRLYLPGVEFKESLFKKMRKVKLKVGEFLSLFH